jgi:hypothetical protein
LTGKIHPNPSLALYIKPRENKFNNLMKSKSIWLFHGKSRKEHDNQKNTTHLNVCGAQV